jgi:predicted dehydrogenase
MSDRADISRRGFLSSAGIATGAAFPYLLPRHALGAHKRLGANDRVRIGVIGVGNRAGLLIDQLPKPGQVVAVADCFLSRAEEAVAKRKASWDIYQDYRKILDRKDIDGVIVATPDHGRVLPCIHSCQAGKDVYGEKPLTLYPAEGRVLVKAARRYKRIFQVGSQQRSMRMNQIASELILSGGLGKISLVHGVNYDAPNPMRDFPEGPAPAKLNWDVWLGQAPARPYSNRLFSSWMSWIEYSGGDTTNWGAHGLDQIQWSLGMSQTGPVELWPMEGGPKGAIAFRYANGVTVQLDLPHSDLQSGGRFIGEKGSIDLWRNNFKLDAPGVTVELPPRAEVQKWRDEVALWQAEFHMGHWMECMVSRTLPNADVEIGHRSITVCHLVNITRRLNRRLKWDPVKEDFAGDAEAHALANRQRRKGWELPKI